MWNSRFGGKEVFGGIGGSLVGTCGGRLFINRRLREGHRGTMEFR